METSADEDDAVTGEARLRIDGGLARFPGLARERRVALGELPDAVAREIAQLAGQADFFACPAPADDVRPDARTYCLRLTIGARSRELRIREPVSDPALARLVSLLRRVTSR